MRLIDADKILYTDLNSDMPQSKVRVYVAFKERIDEMPTADAIPVSFLESLRDNARSAEAADMITEILRLWDKEAKG